MGLHTNESSNIPKPASSPQSLQKFKALGWSATSELDFLIRDAGKERGIWANNGLDPEFVIPLGRSPLARDIKDQVASGVQIGLGIPSNVILARSTGLPVKIVAVYYSETAVKIYVKVDSPVKTVKDLDGRKIGIAQAGGTQESHVAYLNSKFGITAQFVPVGNLTNMVVSLKLGKIDAFMSPDGAPLRLVDSGELRILLRMADVIPKPWAGLVVLATEDLIQQNPDLVRKFVKATLETVKYLKDNPRYASL
jgi:ABC-type nitrate/sulfonate/bicarbonate transport system substrate-binding protein